MVASRASAHNFDYASLLRRARTLAQRPFQAQRRMPVIGAFSYDQYRAIHFRPSRTLWPHRRFHLQFFAPGYRFVRAVRIHIVTGHRVAAVPFVLARFRYPEGLYPHVLPAHMGYVGFRVLYSGYHPGVSPAATNNQVIVFLGASYFRAKGADEQFGLSARALAIDTIDSRPEEFPHFIAYWIRRPHLRARVITVYALMNSPSATAAFRFRIAPGRAVKVAVRSTFFLRRAVHELGFAPLSSMYMYDLCDRRPWAYLRPAVHDSEGFLLKTRRNVRWRQLANPAQVRQFLFPTRHLQGFGLIQRDRHFSDYESVSMAYQRRPSVWIRPRGSWGPGQATLVEIPSPNETNDNIAVFWQPAHEPRKLVPYPLNYDLVWNGSGPRESVARVRETLASARVPRRPTRFVVLFTGRMLARFKPERLSAQLHCGKGGVFSHTSLRMIKPDVAQLRFRVLAKDGRAVRVTARLVAGGRTISEVWDYVLAPQEPPIQVLNRPAQGHR